MANILNCRAVFHRFGSSRREEAAAFGRRNLTLQSIDGFFELTKFEKVKESNIVKCLEQNYFNYNR